jgi:DNA-directed RNA polymerase subunit RPC12/RpoP
MSDRQPVLMPDGKLHQFLLSVAGKGFRCACGCNVFHKPDDQDLCRYKCNSCGEEFTTE